MKVTITVEIDSVEDLINILETGSDQLMIGYKIVRVKKEG